MIKNFILFLLLVVQPLYAQQLPQKTYTPVVHYKAKLTLIRLMFLLKRNLTYAN